MTGETNTGGVARAGKREAKPRGDFRQSTAPSWLGGSPESLSLQSWPSVGSSQWATWAGGNTRPHALPVSAVLGTELRAVPKGDSRRQVWYLHVQLFWRRSWGKSKPQKMLKLKYNLFPCLLRMFPNPRRETFLCDFLTFLLVLANVSPSTKPWPNQTSVSSLSVNFLTFMVGRMTEPILISCFKS